ncbi:MAG: 50S ribosomal protein L21e [Candidatus Poseidoniia archaeon]|jgi:large subunit ribosomal protein L21e|nr:50S ribosomal protein L21e [Candidatus Poseidoniia archaeon]
MKRSQGLRSGSRKKFTRDKRERGLSPITRILEQYGVGESVNIVIDPSIQRGQPHHRFHGLTGTVIRMQGKACVVSTKEGDAVKQLIIRPEHLRRAK